MGTAAMTSTVAEAIATSTAHGIGRAVTSKSIPMKMMWCVLFTLFLGMFIRTSVTLVPRLTDGKLVNSYEIDKVPFVFPDLYFCPKNPYSGSYPFALSENEAKEVNSEVARLSQMYDTRFPRSRNIQSKGRFIQNSFPFHLATRYLAQQRPQAVHECTGTPTMGQPVTYPMLPSVEPFSHPENLICFKVRLTDGEKAKLESDNWQLNLKLSTDPFFADFLYNGSKVEPIRQSASGGELPFQDWSLRYGSERLRETGFTMLIVPPGAYPSFAHEAKFQLAPSNSYSVALSMVETQYSDDLQGKHCSGNQQTVQFKDPSSESSVEFNYSYAACYYSELVKQMMETVQCLPERFPIVSHLRDSPYCLNMSQMSKEAFFQMQRTKFNWTQIERVTRERCRGQQPCRFATYSASFSFSRWPSIGSSVADEFAQKQPSRAAPAWRQLIEMAKELQSSNHSAHIESLFRSYISESLIQVSISAQRSTSSQVSIAPAYSVTMFLADTGGLLGLYIGCSLLTVCELLELVYRLLAEFVNRKCSGGAPEDSGNRIDAEQQLQQKQELPASSSTDDGAAAKADATAV